VQATGRGAHTVAGIRYCMQPLPVGVDHAYAVLFCIVNTSPCAHTHVLTHIPTDPRPPLAAPLSPISPPHPIGARQRVLRGPAAPAGVPVALGGRGGH
jgi:hypothetical protein